MAPMEFRLPVRRVGRFVTLIPLERGHAESLARAGRDPNVWTFLRFPFSGTPDKMRLVIDELLRRQASGRDLPFTVLESETGTPIGMTRFLNISREDRCVEVGGTWFDSTYWRSPCNTDSKRLMLGYAFEEERAHRVELKTDERNVRSQQAIERIGGRREGVHREHVVLPDGRFRSSVYYSVLESEWPAVRRQLDEWLARPWSSRPMSSGTGPVASR